ncbi:TetR/AcrR family transcriptional regulator [Pseudomonas typographi]|uniref:TetR/AcrR family transcriptional regulator n=1 Tax=Pseudomonas typographi TaxID=2715964 RepID=UPI001684F151|nr:TetR/AcrR family transcriptional regulator [Pseudomonas typographi]MBD1554380.1 TetR/AcrR family transcriptional regulator [Pseudomonas typographi]
MTQTNSARGPLWGRTPASQQRRHDILLAAKKVFFERGYPLASVDQIAEAASTTKRTVYDHFGSKQALFAEVMAFAGEQFVGRLPKVDDLPEVPADGLRTFAARLVELVEAPDSLRFQRLVIAEAERHPAMGRALYETVVLGAQRVLASYLDACVERGAMRPHDTATSARIVVDVATSGPRLRGLIGLAVGEADTIGDRALAETITALT